MRASTGQFKIERVQQSDRGRKTDQVTQQQGEFKTVDSFLQLKRGTYTGILTGESFM
jgi:hypothetical protein